jgi:hypothetical protein
MKSNTSTIIKPETTKIEEIHNSGVFQSEAIEEYP